MTKRIFIVEDDEDIREMLEMFLNEPPFVVNAFANAGDFLAGLRAAPPDLILLDIKLPDGNGVDICREIKSLPAFRSVPVLLMSANMHYENITTDSGAEEFISKPFDIMALREKIEARISA
ncbi:response regulator [Pedobacter yulinensis]|uniref:Response regulator n=1 Tax=Pedobacter yulinensis TaxID=2126353 RepID=A0A2T3HGJ3_9SPHI|nr:response regulator [Pedobacter yulinensis]PST81557.1 response regulator [Pedobacter yulinensis]